MVVVLMVFCFFLPETKARRPGPACLRAANLGLGAIDPQPDPRGLGVGEHVRQGPKSHAGVVGDCEATHGQQRADLPDGAGDRGAGNAVQRGEREPRA